MSSFNKVILMGNLTRDPEVRFTPSGTAVCEIGLAVNERVKSGEQWVEKPVFVDVTLWGKTAENAGNYLTKGRPVLVEGRLQLDTWDDKQSGQKRSKLRVVCEELRFVGTKPSGDGTAHVRSESAAEPVQAAFDGDVPF